MKTREDILDPRCPRNSMIEVTFLTLGKFEGLFFWELFFNRQLPSCPDSLSRRGRILVFVWGPFSCEVHSEQSKLSSDWDMNLATFMRSGLLPMVGTILYSCIKFSWFDNICRHLSSLSSSMLNIITRSLISEITKSSALWESLQGHSSSVSSVLSDSVNLQSSFRSRTVWNFGRERS